MNNLFLITGTEEYEKNEMLEKIKTDFGSLEKGINYIVLDSDSIYRLIDEINTYAFGYDKKMIVVKLEKKDDDDKPSQKELISDEILETLKVLDNSVFVVFLGSVNSKSKLYKTVQEYGKIYAFESKKENEMILWCKEYFAKDGIIISAPDLAYLVDLCGTSKQSLKNEMDKLICFSLDEKTVSRADIDKLCVRTSDVIIFDLTDSLGSKNVKRALVCLEDLLENKEPIQKIMIMIAKHFKSLLVAKVAMAKGKDVLAELNTKSNYAANKYKEQSRRFEEKELVRIIRELAKLDIDSKLGKIDLKIGLEKFICTT